MLDFVPQSNLQKVTVEKYKKFNKNNPLAPFDKGE